MAAQDSIRLIALATPRPIENLESGLKTATHLIESAAAEGAAIVCFPEAWLPGLRGQGFPEIRFGPDEYDRALSVVAAASRRNRIAVIMGLEQPTDDGRRIVAVVFDASGNVIGCQTKNQLDPSEDQYYIPGTTRTLFDIDGLRFGVAICHEGWRYPETVRWAARRGAHIVFHPQLTGTDAPGVRLTNWGDPTAPYYEKAMLMRSIENTIYFASVNYCVEYQEAATSVIEPSGRLQAFLEYGKEGLLVQPINLASATGLLAQRFAPERYAESD